jgi:hypothetical protein
VPAYAQGECGEDQVAGFFETPHGPEGSGVYAPWTERRALNGFSQQART